MGRRSGKSEGVSGSTRRVTATVERIVAGANSRAGYRRGAAQAQGMDGNARQKP